MQEVYFVILGTRLTKCYVSSIDVWQQIQNYFLLIHTSGFNNFYTKRSSPLNKIVSETFLEVADLAKGELIGH